MNRNSFFAFITVSIIASIILQILRHQVNGWLILGGAMALVLGPYLISALIRFFSKLFKRNLTDKSFLVLLTIIWCIFFLLNIVGSTR